MEFCQITYFAGSPENVIPKANPLNTEGYTVAIRGGNEVNTKGKRQYMQYVHFPMLNCEENTLPKCEGDPI